MICYKLLNLTHANDLNYFLESPYATWNVLSERINYELLSLNNPNNILPQEVSLLISAKALLFCPLIILAIYLFKESTYQILTILTPFAFIEFLHIKFDKIFLIYEYYLIFMILALHCIMFRVQTVKKQTVLKTLIAIIVVIQFYTGYIFLQNSPIADEKNFISMVVNRQSNDEQNENHDVAGYINSLPEKSRILVDDAIAYPIVAFVKNIRQLSMPYQDSFASALESPDKYDDYILIATARNIATGYTQVNDKYIGILKVNSPTLNMRKIYETQNWAIYEIIGK